MAEAGRGLVLAGVVLAGRVEETLRCAARHDVADGWRDGGEAGRIAAIAALWDTKRGGTLLATPIVEEISVMLAATTIDAVVYLVPPVAPDSAGSDDADLSGDLPGHAVVLRPLLGEITVHELPGLASLSGTPLEAYQAALDEALASYDPKRPSVGGFRSGPRGQAWADALEDLGAWTYSHVMGPLVEQACAWPLDRLPHLALIPLRKLAAIPYAAAWTADPASPAGRRYAIDDVTLSYAASARLLGEVARRPRQKLSDRVVLVSDPTGQFPMTRRVARDLASRQYPDAEVYGLKSAPNGPATTAALLAALPGRGQPGASLLQLATHGTTFPTARLQTMDGWLELTRILGQARDRPADAPGGLVITNACLTDSTRANYDESLTLATAFLAAGATSVIGTRWPVDDDTTAALSLRLHHHLQMAYTTAEALRRAQLDLLRPEPDIRRTLGRHLAALEDSRLSHPVTWAGSVHHGI
jgi:CHAT domain